MEMRVQKHCTFMLLSILVSVSLVVGACAKSLPTRQDCIVQVSSLAPNKTEFGKDGLLDLHKAAVENGIPFAGAAIPNKNTVYVQYTSMCRKRIEMTRKLFGKIMLLPYIRIDKIEVKPGPKTINIFGPSWSDGSPPWKRKKR